MKPFSQSVKVYNELRRKILTNQFGPDTRLKEDAWSKKLSVSRMAVREALNRLLGEGLVIYGEKGGYFVCGLTNEDIHEIRQLREILEVGALRLAFKRLTPAHLKQLEKICEDFTSMVEQGYFSGAVEADMKFHETIMEAAGNDQLLQVYHSSHIPLFHRSLGRTQQYLDDYKFTDDEHRKIVQFLKEKKLKQAEEMLSYHFARGEAAVLEIA